MGWLDAHAERLAAQKKAKEEAEEKQRKFYQSWHDRRAKALTEWVASHLEELVGRDTEYGPLSIEQERLYATVKAGDEKLAIITFSFREEEKYDRDDCAWGTGYFYETQSFHIYKEWTDINGNKHYPGTISFMEDDIAEYFLAILKPEVESEPQV